MTRSSIRLVVVLAVVLAAAACLALLAVAVGSQEDALAEADVRLAAPPGSPATIEGPRAPLAGLAGAMLGAGDDWDYREALVELRELEASPPAAPGAEAAAGGRVEALLSGVAADAENAARASAAANLAGVLYARDAELDRTSRTRFLQLALEAFREAVRLDPANGEAKFNLELLVRVLATGAGGVGDESGSQGSAGAGSSPGGSGY